MVHAFLIHTLVEGTCHVLYSTIFTQENDHLIGNTVSVDIQERNKQCLLQVACRVQSEYSFRCAVEGNKKSTLNDNTGTVDKDDIFSSMKFGMFRLFPGEPFFKEKVVLWKGLNNCAYALVCDDIENRVTAQNILSLIIKYTQQYCDALTKPHEVILGWFALYLVLLKPDIVECILHHFLPAGQLMFMNHRVVRQFEKELNATINNK